ncbi:hypothetical protein [Antarctobacter heliothermus]|uniref:Uncharacterized protein n=1 Tax=Antarctobacter heliothermus TaxID=74033 RepID=A0A239KZA5_9RHOB|nr:hypothetical protein [Antarctobacter heliothermus]SNT23390.1 hypothetical protein SAMN04488078_107516 [Antarctobacter heliothermus]
MSYHKRFDTSSDEIERLIYYMPTVAERARGEWAHRFATSIVKQSKRPNWRPSPKQSSMMSRLVAEMFAHGKEEGDCNVIE